MELEEARCATARRERSSDAQLSLRRRHSAPLRAQLEDEGSSATNIDLRKLAALTTVYSLIEGMITYPYDLVKTRQQMAAPGSQVTRLTTTAYVHQIIETQGPRALYRGFGWNVLGGVPSEVAYYAVYTQAKQAMLQTHLGQRHPSAVFAGAGLLADLVSVLLWVPTDLISQRLQLQEVRTTQPPALGCADHQLQWLRALSRRDAMTTSAAEGVSAKASLSDKAAARILAGRGGAIAAEQPSCPTGLQVALGIYQREGVLGLWRGTGATMASLAPNSAVWWLTHENAKSWLAMHMRRDEDHAAVLAASGTLAGISSTLATIPLDVVKTRLQCSDSRQSALTVLRDVLQQSGWRGLYSGIVPRLAAAVPRSVCTVLAYERAIALCKRPALS